MTMIRMPDATGTGHFAGGAVDQVQQRLARRAPPSASWLSTFSTTTTAASTSMPMAMARPPRLIRLADRPNGPHQDEGGQRGQRQHQRHHHRGPQVAEEGQQQHHHQHDGFDQRAWIRWIPRGRRVRCGRRRPRSLTSGGSCGASSASRALTPAITLPALAPRRPSTRPCTARPLRRCG
jgi:hypothetical protein